MLNTFKSQYILYSAAEIDKKKIDRLIKVQQSPFQALEGQQMDLQFSEGCLKYKRFTEDTYFEGENKYPS